MNNNFDIDQLIRPNIKKLEPYHSARQDFSDGLLLDANENAWGPPFDNEQQLHRYPDPLQHKLRQKIADWRGVDSKNVFTGAGSDEGIDLLCRIFCRPGKDRVITLPPTYGMYGVSANIHNIAVDKVQLGEEYFQPQVNKVLDAAGPNTKMLFICSPNNPTGSVSNQKRVTKLIENFPGIVIIDEAYIDFSDQESWASKVTDYPNLVVLQTMSKSFGLAGIRLGISYASENIIDYMMKVKPPYNISKPTARLALRGLQNLDTVQRHLQSVKNERQNLRKQLRKLDFVQHIYPSDANFLLVQMQNAKKIYEALTKEQIVLRYRGDEPLCDDCLRITIGTPQENKTLIEAIKQLSL